MPWMARTVGGALGIVPMTAVMLVLFRRLPSAQQYHLPPREITEEVAHRVGRLDRLAGDRGLAGASLVAHLLFGALAGAVFHPLSSPGLRHPILKGSLYGIAVWALSYLGWIPALHILKPATEHPAPRNRMMIIAHLVWGASAALVAQRITRRRLNAPPKCG